MSQQIQTVPLFRTRNGRKVKVTTRKTVTKLYKAFRSVKVTEITNKKKAQNNPHDTSPLQMLELSNQMIKKCVIKQVQNKTKEPKKNECQGYILDNDFTSGNSNKRSRDGETIAQKCGHYIDMDNLKRKKDKYAIFVEGDNKLSVLVIKSALSVQGKKGLRLMEKIHEIVKPILLKLCCKISGLPMGWRISDALSSDDAKKRWGNVKMEPEYLLQTGRSCKMHYKNKNGDEKCFQIENPVSRMSYYSMDDIDKLWNSNEYKISQYLGEYEGENKKAIFAYFEDMKNIYKKYLPYFFSPEDREKYNAEKMTEAYFGERFHFSSNLFTPNSPCACHHDTIPKQAEFPSGITAMASEKNGLRRKMGRGDGELCFVHLGCNVQYNFGDVVLMKPSLYHGLLPLKGPRYSLVLYNNRGTIDNLAGEN